MTAWTSEELTRIADAEELRIASRRRDGTLRTPVTIWVVRHGDDLYVRSVNGPTAAWYRGTRTCHQGHIWAGGVDKDVSFADVDRDLANELNAECRRTYRRYAASIIDAINSQQAQSATLALVPQDVDSPNLM